MHFEGLIRVKGKNKAIATYSPLALGGLTYRLPASNSMLLERERETLEFVHALQILREGKQKPRDALFYVGQAGAGKTELLRRIYHLSVSHNDTVDTVYVDADPTDRLVKLALWKHIFRQLLLGMFDARFCGCVCMYVFVWCMCMCVFV